MLASSGGQIETVELLLKYGAITSHRLPKVVYTNTMTTIIFEMSYLIILIGEDCHAQYCLQRSGQSDKATVEGCRLSH